jgi:hypothetical protein
MESDTTNGRVVVMMMMMTIMVGSVDLQL